MKTIKYIILLFLILFLFSCSNSENIITTKPELEQYLFSGKLKQGEKDYSNYLKSNGNDTQAYFELGIIQFLYAVENFIGDFSKCINYRNFMDTDLSLETYQKPISYKDFRGIFERYYINLEKATKSLNKVDSEVKTPIHLGLIHLDVNGNGKIEDAEKLGSLFSRIFSEMEITEDSIKEFYISFDTADAHWLSGYCYLMMHLMDIFLAYDWEKLFYQIAPYMNIKTTNNIDNNSVEFLYFRLLYPERLKNSYVDIMKTISNSRTSWDYILKETDNEHEWIPSPSQTGPFPDVVITEDMIEMWRLFLDEIESVYMGKKLLPITGSSDGPLMNVNKFLFNGKDLDFINFNAYYTFEPYIEEGEPANIELTQQMQNTFRGNFWLFAGWFN